MTVQVTNGSDAGGRKKGVWREKDVERKTYVELAVSVNKEI